MESSYMKGRFLIGPMFTMISDEKWERAFGPSVEKPKALRMTVQKSCPSCGDDLLVEYVDSMNAVTIACTSINCRVFQRVDRSAVVPPQELFLTVANEVFHTVVDRMKADGHCPLCRGTVEVQTIDGDVESATCLQCGYTASYNSAVSVDTVETVEND